LRGIVAATVEVRAAELPVHSGVAGGALADAAIALNVILSRLYWKNGPLPIPHYYDRLRPLGERERKSVAALAPAGPKFRAPGRAELPCGVPGGAGRAVRQRGGREPVRADVAAAGDHGHRAGGQRAQDRVQPGAAGGAGEGVVPDRAGPGPRRGAAPGDGALD